MPFVKGSVGEEICAGDRSKGVSCRLGGENGGRPAPSGEGEKNHGKLSLQNESITRKANGGAWMIRERTLPLKGRSIKLVYIARRDNSSTKGESEVKGVFGVGYG